MRVLISSVGTRGDVQPAIALAGEIRKLGLDVRMCVPPNFMGWATGLGFDANPIGIEMRAPPPGVKPPPIPDLIADQFDRIGAAAADCQLIVGAGIHQYAARSIAELQGIPSVIAAYAPVSLPSTDLAPPGQAQKIDDPEEILRLWADNRKAWNARSLDRVNANRQRLGLTPVTDVLDHILGDQPWLAADPTLAPAPSASGMRVVQTGAWILPDRNALPPELAAFLQDGDPPVYIGLGSMPAEAGASRPLIEAARAAGRRVILARGWASLDIPDDTSDCIAIGDVNHQELFPRVAAVMHHGGAGTTTVAAMIGTPQIALPMFSDQFYFARRIGDLEIGSSVPFAELSVDALASALDQALKPAVAAKARDVSTKIIVRGASDAAQRLSENYG